MPHDRLALLEESITTLKGLASTFASDLTASREQSLNVFRRTSKELLLSITVLLPKLEAARAIFDELGVRPSRCERCDDA